MIKDSFGKLRTQRKWSNDYSELFEHLIGLKKAKNNKKKLQKQICFEHFP